MQSNSLLQGFWVICLATGMLLVLEGFFGSAEDAASSSMANGVDSVSIEVVLQELLAHDSIPESQIIPPPPVEDTLLDGPMGYFFAALNQIKQQKRKVRVAYFGDSVIEGDLVTSSLRNDLQELFGGKGVGFVPLTSQTTLPNIRMESVENFFSVGPTTIQKNPGSDSKRRTCFPAPEYLIRFVSITDN